MDIASFCLNTDDINLNRAARKCEMANREYTRARHLAIISSPLLVPAFGVALINVGKKIHQRFALQVCCAGKCSIKIEICYNLNPQILRISSFHVIATVI